MGVVVDGFAGIGLFHGFQFVFFYYVRRVLSWDTEFSSFCGKGQYIKSDFETNLGLHRLFLVEYKS